MRFFLQTDGPGFMDNRILDEWQIPFGAWIDQGIDWIFVNMRSTLDALAFPFDYLIDAFVNDFLAKISWVWVVLAMALIASLARNIKVGAFVAVSLTICGLLGNCILDRDRPYDRLHRRGGVLLCNRRHSDRHRQRSGRRHMESDQTDS